MYTVKVHDKFNNVITFFCVVGFWHRGDNASVWESGKKLFLFIYFFLLHISFVAGAIKSDNPHESIFLTELALMTFILVVKLLYLILKKKEIYELLQRVGVFSIDDHEEFIRIKKKLDIFMKCVDAFIIMAIVIIIALAIIPFVQIERKLFLRIGFPLDYKNDSTAFWIADSFIFTGSILTAACLSVSVTIWYLLFNCALRYDVLGNKLRNMGVMRTADAASNYNKISVNKNQNLFHRDLIKGIKAHQDTKEYFKYLKSVIND